MVSREGELVGLLERICPLQFGSHIEKWMLEIEKGMRLALRESVKRALEDYAPTQRLNWIARWPGQVGFCLHFRCPSLNYQILAIPMRYR